MDLNKMARNCLVVIILTLYFIQLSMTAPVETTENNDQSIVNSDELSANSENIHHVSHTKPKRRQKRLATNTCGGKLAGQIQSLTVARHRQAAMNFLKEVILASKIDLITNNIDVSDFDEYRLHSYKYDYLKRIEETDEPNLSEWHHNMQLYAHTFHYLHEHQKKTRQNADLLNELKELKITAEKILCEIQSMALHLEDKPTLKLITDDEKISIEEKLRTQKRHAMVDEIDLKYTKVFHFDNIHGMTKSLKKCIQDCNCVKGIGQCKRMTDI